MVRQGIGVRLTLPALIRPSQIGNDLVFLPITGLTDEFIFALVYRRVCPISRAAREFINTISQPPIKTTQPMKEPLPPDNPLWQLPNVFMSPHIMGSTPMYDERAALIFIENVRRYLNGEPLYNVVDKQQGY